MSFPTLTAKPSQIEEKSAFNTISVEFDGGYKQTRERHTRDLKTFSVSYVAISRYDRNLIDAHFSTVRGSIPFSWTNIDTGETYTVRYADSPSFPADASMSGLFNISLKLEQV